MQWPRQNLNYLEGAAMNHSAITDPDLRADRSDSLNGFSNLSLMAEERGIAVIKGWILGVV